MSIDDKPLRVACDESEDFSKCARRNSTANDQHEHFTCCCLRHWREPQDMCRKILLEQLKPLLNENGKITIINHLLLKRCLVIAKKPEEIMSELKKDPPTKCVQPEGTRRAKLATRSTDRVHVTRAATPECTLATSLRLVSKRRSRLQEVQ